MAPPKAMDEEEYRHLTSISEAKAAAQQQLRAEEDKELDSFRSSRLKTFQNPLDQTAPLLCSEPQKHLQLPSKRKPESSSSLGTSQPIIAVKYKRRREGEQKGEERDRSQQTEIIDDSNVSNHVNSYSDITSNSHENVNTCHSSSSSSSSYSTAPAVSLALGLDGYGSDSD